MNVQVGQIARIFYYIDLFLIKLAILRQLLRIFVPIHKRNMVFWICHALIWLNFIYYSIYVCFVIFSCSPIKKGWSTQIYPEIPGKCFDVRKAYVTEAGINVASDFSIIILP